MQGRARPGEAWFRGKARGGMVWYPNRAAGLLWVEPSISMAAVARAA